LESRRHINDAESEYRKPFMISMAIVAVIAFAAFWFIGRQPDLDEDRAAAAECQGLYSNARGSVDTLRVDRHLPLDGKWLASGRTHTTMLTCGHYRKDRPDLHAEPDHRS
jgi:hypothetical protein